MNIYSLPPLITSLLILLTGIFVFFKKRSLVNALLSFSYFCIFIWLFGYFVVYNIKDSRIALFWCKVVYTGVIFIPPFFYHFIDKLLKGASNKLIIFSNYIFSLIFIGFLYFTDYIIVGTYKYYWGYQTKVGFLHSFFLIFFVIVLCTPFIKIYKKSKIEKQRSLIEYNRLKYVLLTFVTCFFASLDFIPNYGIEFYPIGFIFVGIMVILLTYTIAVYRLMDINIAITRAGIFGFVYFIVLGIPFIVGGIVKPYLSSFTSNWWIIPVFIGVVLASLGPFIYMRLQKRIEARLRAQEFKSHEALRRLSHNMLRFTDLDVLLRLIVHYLVKILRLNFGCIYLFDTQNDKYILRSEWFFKEKVNLAESFDKEDILINELYLRRLPIVTEELKLYAPTSLTERIRALYTELSGFRINTIIPCFLRNNLLGFLALSDRRMNLSFSQEDINLLMVLSNEAALAIENAQFHQKEKIALIERSRRDALADMAPGASHQFNNRLAAIGSSAELLLFKIEKIDINSVQDEKMRSLLKDINEGLETIDKEVYKGKDITTAILRTARAKINSQEINLNDLLENAYRLVTISHSKSGLDKVTETKFRVNSINKVSNMFASEALLQDCFYNLIDNAFDAIQEKARLISEGQFNLNKEAFQGNIDVTLEQENSSVIIVIKDNGIGLAKENLKRLFVPYFTTKASSGKGTGLGLYVIRDFIEIHNGTINCDSEYGVGTTFTIRLPIKQKPAQKGL